MRDEGLLTELPTNGLPRMVRGRRKRMGARVKCILVVGEVSEGVRIWIWIWIWICFGRIEIDVREL